MHAHPASPRKPRLSTGLQTVLWTLALSGCASAPSLIDRHFGLAVQRAQAQQSQPSTAPVADTDGVSAQGAVMRYQQSFQSPTASTPAVNLGFGAAKAP